MALRSEAYYRQVASDALKSIGCEEPPVPIDELVGSLGIPLRAVNLPAFFTAATVYEDGLPVMIINWARPEPERRRAIAHMLAHILLVLADPENGYPRESADHAEADTVAGELMLPTGMVIEQAKLWFNDYRYLARLFGVSEEEMLHRMQVLGLVRGVPGALWDF